MLINHLIKEFNKVERGVVFMKVNNQKVKQINRNRVFRYVNENGQVSMNQIAKALDISAPTVLTIIGELKEQGLIVEVGEFNSTGGRKAKAFETIKEYRYALGLGITKNHIAITYINLNQMSNEYVRIKKKFENSKKYFTEVVEFVNGYVKENEIPDEKIVGIGISAPVIIDRSTNLITNSHELGLYNVPCSEWTKHFKYPAKIINDANAGALAEWLSYREDESMVYLSLSNTVGGAVVYQAHKGNLYSRRGYFNNVSNMFLGNNFRSCEFGHMVIHPNGRECYCGKRGCSDAYLSARLLDELDDGDLQEFFNKLESGEPKHVQVWKGYVDDLVLVIDNLQMLYNMTVVIGGYVGGYIDPYIDDLQKRLAEINIFENDGSYLRACRCKMSAIALGSASYQMESFINTI